LADLSLARLTELLEERELPYAAHGYGSPGPASVEELAQHLLGDDSVARALSELDTPQTQLLVAAATLAQQVHGSLPGRARPAARWTMFTAGGDWQGDEGESAPG